MLRFYAGLIVGVPKALHNATDGVLTVAAVVMFFLALFNQPLAGRIVNAWDGFDPRWSLLPVSLLALYALMRANYERFMTLRAALDALDATNAQLALRLDERERRRAVLARLAERITEGNRLLTQRLGTEAELPPWVGAVDRWYAETVAWLNEALSAAAAASFSTATGFSSAHVPVVNEEHNRYKNLIGFKLTYLRSLAARLEAHG